MVLFSEGFPFVIDRLLCTSTYMNTILFSYFFQDGGLVRGFGSDGSLRDPGRPRGQRRGRGAQDQEAHAHHSLSRGKNVPNQSQTNVLSFPWCSQFIHVKYEQGRDQRKGTKLRVWCANFGRNDFDDFIEIWLKSVCILHYFKKNLICTKIASKFDWSQIFVFWP